LNSKSGVAFGLFGQDLFDLLFGFLGQTDIHFCFSSTLWLRPVGLAFASAHGIRFPWPEAGWFARADHRVPP
jgi:hypothetical protein